LLAAEVPNNTKPDGQVNWKAIQAILQRPAQKCSDRYKFKMLRENMKKGHFTDEEVGLFSMDCDLGHSMYAYVNI
jgi:hypothetical protein